MVTTEGTPEFAGSVLYTDSTWRYSLRYPEGWHAVALPGSADGLLWAPDRDDYATRFSVEPKDLGVMAGEEELADLLEGFIYTLEQLPDCRIESQNSWTSGDVTVLEARFTARERNARRKRWARLIYKGTYQYHLMAQGATADDFKYWLPTLTQIMESFTVE